VRTPIQTGRNPLNGTWTSSTNDSSLSKKGLILGVS
jgi:hypothetical protein